MTRIRFVSLKKPLFSSRTFYFSFVLFINIPRKNFMADWCVRLEFESVHQVCDCFVVVPLSLRGRLVRYGSYYTPFGRFGQRCARCVCPKITAHGLAILRAVDEFRFEGRSTKGGRETADAICVAPRLISLSFSLSRMLFLAITILVF